MAIKNEGKKILHILLCFWLPTRPYMESGKYILFFLNLKIWKKKKKPLKKIKLGHFERKLPDQKTYMGGWVATTHAQFCVDSDPTFFQWNDDFSCFDCHVQKNGI